MCTLLTVSRTTLGLNVAENDVKSAEKENRKRLKENKTEWAAVSMEENIILFSLNLINCNGAVHSYANCRLAFFGLERKTLDSLVTWIKSLDKESVLTR